MSADHARLIFQRICSDFGHFFVPEDREVYVPRFAEFDMKGSWLDFGTMQCWIAAGDRRQHMHADVSSVAATVILHKSKMISTMLNKCCAHFS